MPTTISKPEWLRTVTLPSPDSKVDRKAGVIREVKLAEIGPFNDPRGHFNRQSLETFKQLASRSNKGIKSRWTHSGQSSDSAGKHLGRLSKFQILGEAFVGDLKFDPAAYKTPQHGNLAEYIMTLVESDPEAFGMSFVAKFDFFNADGERIDDDEMYQAAENTPNSTLWIPRLIHSIDVVGDPAATSSFLSITDEELSSFGNASAVVSRAMDVLFAEQSRDAIDARARSFLSMYLSHRFGEQEMPDTEHVEDVDDTDVEDNENPQDTSAPPTEDAKSSATPDEDAVSAATELAQARSVEIAELCQLASCMDRVAEFLSSKKPIAVIRKELVKLSNESHSDSHGLPPGEDAEPNLSVEKLAEKEYLANKKFAQQMGLSKDQYIDAYLLEHESKDRAA